MNAFWAIMADQVLFPILGIIVTAILGWLAKILADKARYTLTTEQQATLHSALMTGLRAALMKGAAGDAAIASAVGYALQKGAPDAIRGLDVSAETLRELAMAKLDILNKGQAETQTTAR